MPGGYSYRTRLVLFMSSVAVLMLIMLGISYYSARWVIWEDADMHRDREVELYSRSMGKMGIDLVQYAKTIRDDLRVQEYLFAVVRIGAQGDPLVNLINEQFHGLSYDHLIVIGDNGSVVLGKEYAEMVETIKREPADERPQLVYLTYDKHVELAAILPMYYSGEIVGRMAITRVLDSDWLNIQSRNPSNHLLLTREGVILASTFAPHIGGPFKLRDGTLMIQDDAFRLAEIEIPAVASGDIPRLWLAESKLALVDSLARYNRIMIVLMVASVTLILITALVAVNSFSKPINRLIALTRDIADGRLPSLKKSQGGTEIDTLLNQFADLTEALRQKDKEVELAHEQLRRSAITDELTRLYNRRYLNEVYPKLLAQAERDHCDLTAILCDLDHFKQINDNHGHAAGDYCLVEFSRVLSRNCRANDYLFRMGGEEFLVLSLNKSHDDGIRLAEKIRESVKACSLLYEGKPMRLTVSCGVSCVESNAHYKPTHSRLVSLADHALYQAKAEGRDAVRFYSDNITPTPLDPAGAATRR